jgi:aldehyde dehydrogenase
MMGNRPHLQKKNIVLYKTGKEEGAELLIGGDVKKLGGDLWILHSTNTFQRNNKMRIFKKKFSDLYCKPLQNN